MAKMMFVSRGVNSALISGIWSGRQCGRHSQMGSYYWLRKLFFRFLLLQGD